MAIKALGRKLSDAELNAPDLDEGERDVETYLLPSGEGIEDDYLREVWQEVANQFNGTVTGDEPEEVEECGGVGGKPGPCSEPGSDTGGKAKPAGFGGKAKAAAVAVKTALGNAEHWAAQKGSAAFAKLPAPAQKVVRGVYKTAFATYIAGQKAAHAVASEVGGIEHADRVAKILTAVDMIGAKVIPGAVGAVASGGLATAASFVPLGSATYLAYATVRHPAAVANAARKGIKSVMDRVRGGKRESVEGTGEPDQRADIELLLSRFQAVDDPDWYEALLSAALDEASDLRQAVEMADAAYEEMPAAPEGNEDELPDWAGEVEEGAASSMCGVGQNPARDECIKATGASKDDGKPHDGKPPDAPEPSYQTTAYLTLKGPVKIEHGVAPDGTKAYRWDNTETKEKGEWSTDKAKVQADGEKKVKSPKAVSGFGDKWREGLSKPERESFEDYSLNSDAVNSKLRSGFGGGEQAKILDKAIRRSVIPEDVVVYRGLTKDLDFQAGSTFSDKAFVSTSRNRATAEEFMTAHGQQETGGTLMEIKVPKGAKGADTKGLSPSYGSESEILLPRGSKFSVTGVRTENGRKVYEVKLVA